jgi:hypothetical protein
MTALFKWQSDNPDTGMSSFTPQGCGKPMPGPTMYKVVRTWGGVRTDWITGQSEAAAQAIADNLNGLAAEYHQADEYTVEREG